MLDLLKRHQLACITLLAFFLWYSFAPNILRYGQDFDYSLKLDSQNQFFDQQKNTFSAPVKTVNSISYTAEDILGNNLVVNAIFNVRKPNEKKVTSVSKKYVVNDLDLSHKPHPKFKNRSGYLFGPQDNLSSFQYWHVNYDVPFEMKLIATDTLGHTRAAQYRGTALIDQSNSLHHLPGVPEQLGINLDVEVTVWIDPRTGWLLNFEDKGKAFYYDKQTQKRIFPWSQFQNVMTEESVQKNIVASNGRHILETIVRKLTPLCFLLIFLMSLILHRIKNFRVVRFFTVRGFFSAASVLLLGLIVMIGWIIHIPELIQILPTFVPMQFNTALGFFVTGISLFCLIYGNSLWTYAGGVLLLLLGLVTASQYLLGINVGLDELFFEHSIGKKTSHPGRMAPNTAVCFLLCGLFFLCHLVQDQYKKVKLLAVITGLVIVLAGVACGGYILGVETAYGWGSFTRMALHTSIGFLITALGFSQVSQDRNWPLLERLAFVLVPSAALATVLVL